MTRGRPKLPAGESRSETLVLRMQPEQLKLLEAEATTAGVAVSEIARLKLSASLICTPKNLHMEFALYRDGKKFTAYSGVANPKVLRFMADEIDGATESEGNDG